MTDSSSTRIQHRLLEFSWLWAGLGLFLLSWADLFPGVMLAGRFADASGLSAPYVHLLQTSQWSLALALITGGIGAALITMLIRRGFLQLNPAHVLFPLSIAVAGFALAAGIQWGLFGQIPHITDATSHWFQSQIFASCHLTAPEPPCLEAFFQHNVIINAKGLWYSKYFPGHALWLIWPLRLWMMPLSFALFLSAAYRVIAHYFDRTTAGVSSGLLAVSPLMLLLSASFMSHITLLMWMTGSWAFLTIALNSPRPRRKLPAAIAAGFCSGMGVLTRPQDAVLFGIWMLCITAPALWRQKKRLLPILSGIMLGGLPPLLFLLLWNHELYGHIFASGYHFAGDTPVSKTPIIRDTIGFSSQFTAAKAIKQSFWVSLRLNQALLGWPVVLPLLIPALCIPSIRQRNGLLLIGAAWLYLPYFFFHYYGFELEARYCATSAPLLILILTRLLVVSFRATQKDCRLRHALTAWVTAGFLYAAFYYWPVYLWPRYANGYEEGSSQIHQTAQAAGLNQPALILMPNEGFLYSSGFIYTDPALQNSILYARDVLNIRTCLQDAFPNRHLYRYIPASNTLFHGTFLPLTSDQQDP